MDRNYLCRYKPIAFVQCIRVVQLSEYNIIRRQYQHISNEQRLTESNSAREHNQMVYLPSSHIRPDRLHQLNRRTDKTMTNHTNQSKTLSQSNPYILRHLPRYGLLIILNCSTSGPTLQVEEEHIKNNK